MNENENTPHRTDIPAMNDRILDGVRAHRRKIRVLSGATFVFSCLAMVASVALVWCYLLLVLPKQKQMLQDAEYPTLKTSPGITAETPAMQEAIKRLDGKLNAEVLMMHVMSVGISIVCIAVGVLGLGTIILVALVMLQRRATLSQISDSLAQISRQLNEMRDK
jgi:hypothetical protein